MGYLIFWVIVCILIASQFGEAVVPVFFVLFIGVPALLVAITSSNRKQETKDTQRHDSKTSFDKPKFTPSLMQKSIQDVFNKRQTISREKEALRRDITTLDRRNKIAKMFFLGLFIKRNIMYP